jgi:hypothetical protein
MQGAGSDGIVARWLRLYLPRWYLQRFPLLLGGLLLAYVPFALLAVPALFRSTLVLTANGLIWVTLFTVIAAVVVMATRRTVLLCGPARFNIPWPLRDEALGRWTLAAHLSLAAPIVVIGGWLSASEGEIGALRAVASVLLGAGGAALFVLSASLIHAFLVDASEDLPDLVLPSTRTLFSSVHQRQIPDTWLGTVADRLVRWLRPLLGPGYFTPQGQFLPAHLYAAGICAAFGLWYLGAYFLGHPRYDHDVPALVFVLILVTFATIVLAGVAFFLDRHHLPTLLPIALWVAGMSWISASDHYFALRPAPSPLRPLSPYDIVRIHPPLLTVVAVDGGGIQAAGWAATVLTRVEERWPEFHRSIRFISSISGGSVGTMYFLSALHADRPPTGDELQAVRTAATRGSLNEAAWGFAYPDLWRAIVPIWFYRFEKDRGWAMEQAWRRSLPGPAPILGDWIASVGAGWRPAVAFSATTVENGQRFVFATFAPPESWHLGTIVGTYPGYDIDVPTAARMSATFPYVTPIAAAFPGPGIQAWHYADGGYYDNTGMGIAMRWLDTAMRDHDEEFRNTAVAFIRIRSSPPPGTATPKERAWAYDLIGPLEALLAVRTAAQRERAETELDFVQQLWCERHIAIRTFEFAFDLPDPRAAGTASPSGPAMKEPPLSWQLTPQEKTDLSAAWLRDGNQTELARYLALKDAPVAGVCASGASTGPGK